MITCPVNRRHIIESRQRTLQRRGSYPLFQRVPKLAPCPIPNIQLLTPRSTPLESHPCPTPPRNSRRITSLQKTWGVGVPHPEIPLGCSPIVLLFASRTHLTVSRPRAPPLRPKSAGCFGLTRLVVLVSLPKQMSPAPSSDPVIEFRNVRYEVNGRTILENINLAIQEGETLVLLGRSGSGKTTALKLINRLLDTTAGEVRVAGRSTRDWDPIALRRKIGYVIQGVGLFPHFTVERNVALVPHLEKWPDDRIRSRVEELLRLVGLEPGEFAARYPHQLSGGQRQRVGVARALAADPSFLLMDEPFGALDLLTRSEIQREFHALQQRLAKTTVFVTHDVREALLLANRIGLVEAGRLVGMYAPAEFLSASEPLAAAYVAAFRGSEGIC
jgi:osmoprotectant transport system ATP-binding protein